MSASRQQHRLGRLATITNNSRLHGLMAFGEIQLKCPGGKLTLDAACITLEAQTILPKGPVVMSGGDGAQLPVLRLAAPAPAAAGRAEREGADAPDRLRR